MTAVFLQTLRQLRGQVLGWGLSLAALALMIVPAYEMVLKQGEQMQKLIESYPPELMALFGEREALTSFTTPEGFLSVEVFSLMPIVLGIFAVLAGSGLIARDEEAGLLDLLLAHPVSRAELFFGRVLAALLATAAILAIQWLALSLSVLISPLDMSAGRLAMPFFPLFSLVAFFLAASLLLSQLLPARRLSAMAAGIFFLVSYAVTAAGRIDDRLDGVAQLSAITHFNPEAAFCGFEAGPTLGLLGIALALFALAYARFFRRDIRTGGEGGMDWLPRFLRPKGA